MPAFSHFFPRVKQHLIEQLQAISRAIEEQAQMPHSNQVDLYKDGSPKKSDLINLSNGLIQYLQGLEADASRLDSAVVKRDIIAHFQGLKDMWAKHGTFPVNVNDTHQCGDGCNAVHAAIDTFERVSLGSLRLITHFCEVDRTKDVYGQLSAYFSSFFECNVRILSVLNNRTQQLVLEAAFYNQKVENADEKEHYFHQLLGILLGRKLSTKKKSPNAILYLSDNSKQGINELKVFVGGAPAANQDNIPATTITTTTTTTVTTTTTKTTSVCLIFNFDNWFLTPSLRQKLDASVEALKVALREAEEKQLVTVDKIQTASEALQRLLDTTAALLTGIAESKNKVALQEKVDAFKKAVAVYRRTYNDFFKFSGKEKVYYAAMDTLGTVAGIAVGAMLGGFCLLMLDLLIISLATPAGFSVFQAVFRNFQLCFCHAPNIVGGLAGTGAEAATRAMVVIGELLGMVGGGFLGFKLGDAFASWSIFKVDRNQTRARLEDLVGVVGEAVNEKQKAAEQSIASSGLKA